MTIEVLVIPFNPFSLVAGEKRNLQNDSVNEILDIDDSDDVAEKRILESGPTMSSSSSNLKSSTDYWQSKCDTSGAKSHYKRAKTPVCSVTDGKNFAGSFFADVSNFLSFSYFKLHILLTMFMTIPLIKKCLMTILSKTSAE